MTFDEALKIKIENSQRDLSKIYRICPNPKTDSNGYIKFIRDIKMNNKLTDKDAFYYSNNSDFEVLEGHYF
ncbi:hypothetical protein [uncultured Aquimarina sp.]|uniref:hypothetical protein n=1 Tax=uncultured Aquimarina sp. TaxID=575652 RepID=UPI00260BE0E9|nr:hypothetical protein [uncultured Aquimarina sp.]